MPRKLTRKQIVKQDVVKSTLIKIWEDIQQYPVLIAGSIIAISSIIIFAYAWVSYSNNKYAAVNEMFTKSLNDYISLNVNPADTNATETEANRKKKYENLIATLNTIKRDYPDSLYAHEALYYLGNVYIKKQDYDKAIQSLTECVNKTNDAVIKGLALYSLAKAYTAAGKYQDALQTIEQLEKTETKSVPGDYVLFQKALIYRKIGDINKSKELIQRIKTEYPVSPLTEELETSS